MEEANQQQDLGSNSVSMDPISTASVSMDEISSSSSSSSSLVVTTTTTTAAVTVSEYTQIKNQVGVSNTGAGSLLQPLVKCSEKVLGEKIEGEIVGSEEEEEKRENGGVVLEQVEIHKEIRVSEMEIGENGGGLLEEEIHKEIRENPGVLLEAVESQAHGNGGVVVLEEGKAKADVKTHEEEIRVASSSLEAGERDLGVGHGGDTGRIRERVPGTDAGPVEPCPRVENNLVSVHKEVEKEAGENGVGLEEGEAEKEVRVSEMETVEDVNGDSKMGPVGDDESMNDAVEPSEEEEEEEDVSGDDKTIGGAETEAAEEEENMVGDDVNGDIKMGPVGDDESMNDAVEPSEEEEEDVSGDDKTIGGAETEAAEEEGNMVGDDVNGDSKMGPVGDDESMNDAVEPSEEEEEEDVSGDGKTIGGAETEAAEEENMVGDDVNGDSKMGPVDDNESMNDAVEPSEEEEEDVSGDDKTIGGAETEAAEEEENMVGDDVKVDSSLAAEDTKPKEQVVDLGILQNMDEFVKHNERNEVVEKGGNEFSASDLVWGKVNSHPWWPGQIFDPQAASKLAKKHQKYDRKRLLVAYFGDQTFAWNVASALKPFEAHFSQMEKQTDMEEFRFAIGSALGEISRRVQRGLICSCVPDESCSEIKSQIITNAGIRADSSRRDGVDKNVGAATFEPCKVVEYVKSFALDPLGGVCDKIENVVTQAQLAAFYRSKGHPRMAEFGFWGGLLHSEAEIPAVISINEEAPSEKRKLESQDKPSSKPAPTIKKHKFVGSFSDDLAGKSSRVGLSQSSNEDGEFRTPGSFKVGESLRRVASQLKGSPPILNSSGGRSRKSAGKIDQSSEKLNEKPKKRKITIPKEYSDPDEMLSQLHLAARDPMKGYSFLTIIVGFFTDYRNSIILDQSGSGKKSGQPKSGGGGNRKLSRIEANAAEIYSDEEDDPYCTDMISGGTPEEQSPRKIQKRKRKPKSKAQSKKDSSIVELEKDPPSSPSLVAEEYSSSEESEGSVYTPDSKQTAHDVSTNLIPEEPDVSNLIKNDADDPSPTALILNFTQVESIPLETDLNKIFSRFGPLLESDTEVTRKTCRAKVVFKNRTDAEVAFSSAGKFSIFGPALSSYQLRYLPSTSSAASPRPQSAASPRPQSAASPVPMSTTSPTLTFEETN